MAQRIIEENKMRFVFSTNTDENGFTTVTWSIAPIEPLDNDVDVHGGDAAAFCCSRPKERPPA